MMRKSSGTKIRKLGGQNILFYALNRLNSQINELMFIFKMLQNPPIQASLIPKFSVCGTPGLPVIGGTEGEGRGKEKGLHHDCRGDGRPCR